jgi:hypothetical protein
VEITAYNNHKKAPSCFRVFGPQPKDTLKFWLEPSFLCNQPFVPFEGWVIDEHVGHQIRKCFAAPQGRKPVPQTSS